MTEQQFDNLLYSDVTFYAREISDDRIQQDKRDYRVAAFIVYGMGNIKKSYRAFLQSMKLDDSEKIDSEEKKRIADEAHEAAERVLKQFR